MPILPTCVTVPLSLGTNDWLLRLSTSEADEDDGDSPANPRYCHLLLLLMIHNPQVKHREKKKHTILFVRDVTYQFQYPEPSEVKNQVYQQSEKEEVDGGEGH